MLITTKEWGKIGLVLENTMANKKEAAEIFQALQKDENLRHANLALDYLVKDSGASFQENMNNLPLMDVIAKGKSPYQRSYLYAVILFAFNYVLKILSPLRTDMFEQYLMFDKRFFRELNTETAKYQDGYTQEKKNSDHWARMFTLPLYEDSIILNGFIREFKRSLRLTQKFTQNKKKMESFAVEKPGMWTEDAEAILNCTLLTPNCEFRNDEEKNLPSLKELRKLGFLPEDSGLEPATDCMLTPTIYWPLCIEGLLKDAIEKLLDGRIRITRNKGGAGNDSNITHQGKPQNISRLVNADAASKDDEWFMQISATGNNLLSSSDSIIKFIGNPGNQPAPPKKKRNGPLLEQAYNAGPLFKDAAVPPKVKLVPKEFNVRIYRKPFEEKQDSEDDAGLTLRVPYAPLMRELEKRGQEAKQEDGDAGKLQTFIKAATFFLDLSGDHKGVVDTVIEENGFEWDSVEDSLNDAIDNYEDSDILDEIYDALPKDAGLTKQQALAKLLRARSYAERPFQPNIGHLPNGMFPASQFESQLKRLHRGLTSIMEGFRQYELEGLPAQKDQKAKPEIHSEEGLGNDNEGNDDKEADEGLNEDDWKKRAFCRKLTQQLDLENDHPDLISDFMEEHEFDWDGIIADLKSGEKKLEDCTIAENLAEEVNQTAKDIFNLLTIARDTVNKKYRDRQKEQEAMRRHVAKPAAKVKRKPINSQISTRYGEQCLEVLALYSLFQTDLGLMDKIYMILILDRIRQSYAAKLVKF